MRIFLLTAIAIWFSLRFTHAEESSDGASGFFMAGFEEPSELDTIGRPMISLSLGDQMVCDRVRKPPTISSVGIQIHQGEEIE